ncbi:hypothetical protein [Actimicrobium sp. CCI2.3]|uniref:hypothetical protein n=1 Tax=Actimicrobium sp. CCI2.3 TaxID=3048616 RepID=UPI002AB4F340|nr:hypothetical protein [Actimicrobium sp. CCI2.3]MDY7576322.1 hypothetical protein [Actimicrobium sp. CCI2.3]MEB0020474.1 hypothetical protein [Actimicrobium sp. CCI2.3]
MHRSTLTQDVVVLEGGKAGAGMGFGVSDLKRFQMQSSGDKSLPGSNGTAGFGNFFRYHGWLSPGVRLFRSIRFQAKALWIALAFLVPLLMTLFYLWSAANDQVSFARTERQGLTFVHPLVDLLKAAQGRRRIASGTAPQLAEQQASISAAFDKVQARQTELGKDFGTEKPFELLLKAHQFLMQTPLAANPDATFKLHSDYIALVLDLMARVADGSQLSLDPDLDTYHMMNISVLRGPMQYENTAQLRGLGSMILNDKELTPLRREQMSQRNAVQDYLDRDVEASYKAGIAIFPEVARNMDMQATDVASDAFRAAIMKQIMGPELTGDAATFLALGNAAVDKQIALTLQVMARLDTQLQARIDRLQGTLTTQFGICLFFVLLASYLMLAFYRVMMGGLQEVAGHLQEITKGNLTTAPKPWGSDEAA